MSRISYIAEFTIADGKAGEFKSKAQGYIDAVEANEPGTLGYQWYVDAAGTRCLLHETFASSEALIAHLQNVGPSLPDLLAIAPITRTEVLGSASAAATEALAALGAVHFPHLAGFER